MPYVHKSVFICACLQVHVFCEQHLNPTDANCIYLNFCNLMQKSFEEMHKLIATASCYCVVHLSINQVAWI